MKLMVIDGNSLMNRAFYGIRLLTTQSGICTNAVLGFLNMYDKLKKQESPDGVAVAFDLHAPTFRHKLYDGYKAGRHAMPEELRQQMPIIKRLLPLMGCTVLEQEGYEADDILGTLAAAAQAGGHDCVLVTGDRDAFQLIDERVTVLLAATRGGQAETVRMDTAALWEQYGLKPAQMIDLKALMGDASDRIPGVPGIGEKTALDLLHRFGSVEALYAQLDTADLRPAVKQKLQAGRDSARLSRELGTICRTVPISLSVEVYGGLPVKSDELAAQLASLELFKLAERWGLDTTATPPELSTAAAQTVSPEEVLAVSAGQRVTVLGHESGVTVLTDGRMAEVAWDNAELHKLLADAAVPKITHDYKALLNRLAAWGVSPAGVETDTMLAAYLLDPLATDYTPERLMSRYGVAAATPIEGVAALADRLGEELTAQGQSALLTDMELPLAEVLAEMEQVGVEVDADGIAAFGQALDGEIAALQQTVFDAVGYEFNVNSPKQLGKAFFEDLGLPGGKKTRTGYSTNADVLERLRADYPVVQALLDYRTLAKLRSTYCDGLLKTVQPDGRIHSSFNQTETRTGRISSTEPNLQNIPVRSARGRELRRFFRAREGWVLVDADYSQIELRVLAHMAAEPTMQAAFNGGEDIHTITAAQVFGVPEEMVTPLMRSRAKAVNFGIIYGIGAHSLAQDIGVSYAEAKAYIDSYLARYAAVAGFMEQLVKEAGERGYAETLFGRRRPLPELRAGNAMTRHFGERVARNAPIQGTAADIIKRAMIRVRDRLRREGLRARLILQIHDELIVEAPADEAATVEALLKEEMEAAAELAVTLTADTHSGRTWFDAK